MRLHTRTSLHGVVAALALSLLATLSLWINLALGLFLYALAAAVFLWSEGPSDPAERRCPTPIASRRAEALFVGLLFLAAAFIRLWRLDRYPAGPGFVESVMGLEAEALASASYAAHQTQPQACFPSLLTYQGLGLSHWLGWNLGTFRAPAALWGALSVVAFYFLLRQFSSIGTASLFSVLYCVNNLHLTLSRLFFPGSLLFFSIATAAALLIASWRRENWPLAGAAGLAAGLSWHGYVPGRLVPLFLLVWFFAATWSRRRNSRPGFAWSGAAAFAAGSLLMGLPVLIWAARNPGVYWDLVGHNGNPNLWAAARRCAIALPEYLRMFHTRPDGILVPTDGLALYPVLRPDPLTQVFLFFGLALCLFHWRRPIAGLIVLGFFLGLVPALAAGNYTPPCTRRALLALPWAYAAAAYGWERVARALKNGGADIGLLRGLIAWTWFIAAGTVALSLRQYFVEIMSNPVLRSSYDVAGAIVGREMARFPDADVKVGYDLALPGSYRLVGYLDQNQRVVDHFPDFLILDWPWQHLAGVKQAEDFLSFSRLRPQLLLLPPYLYPARTLMKRIFPHARTKIYSEARDLSVGPPPWDYNAPLVQLVRVYVPLADVESFKGLADLKTDADAGPSGTGEANFAADHAQETQRLGGLLLLRAAGAQLRFRLAWRGWRLYVDGHARPWGRTLALSQGSHRVELDGRVPAGTVGALPLSVLSGGEDLVSEGFLLPWDIRYGLSATVSPAGARPGSGTVTRYEPLPWHRFWPPEGVPPPATVTWNAKLRVPLDGPYQFRFALPLRGRVLVNGVKIFDDQNGFDSPEHEVALKAGRFYGFEAICTVDAEADHAKTLFLEKMGPANQGWSPLPLRWVSPD